MPIYCSDSLNTVFFYTSSAIAHPEGSRMVFPYVKADDDIWDFVSPKILSYTGWEKPSTYNAYVEPLSVSPFDYDVGTYPRSIVAMEYKSELTANHPTIQKSTGRLLASNGGVFCDSAETAYIFSTSSQSTDKGALGWQYKANTYSRNDSSQVGHSVDYNTDRTGVYFENTKFPSTTKMGGFRITYPYDSDPGYVYPERAFKVRVKTIVRCKNCYPFDLGIYLGASNYAGAHPDITIGGEPAQQYARNPLEYGKLRYGGCIYRGHSTTESPRGTRLENTIGWPYVGANKCSDFNIRAVDGDGDTVVWLVTHDIDGCYYDDAQYLYMSNPAIAINTVDQNSWKAEMLCYSYAIYMQTYEYVPMPDM